MGDDLRLLLNDVNGLLWLVSRLDVLLGVRLGDHLGLVIDKRLAVDRLYKWLLVERLCNDDGWDHSSTIVAAALVAAVLTTTLRPCGVGSSLGAWMIGVR